MPIYKATCPICLSGWTTFSPREDLLPAHGICFPCWINSEEDPKTFDELCRKAGLEPFRDERGVLKSCEVADEKVHDKFVSDN